MEHRLVQLGVRQARYFGRSKTKFQLYLAATVANLTLVAAKAGLPANTGDDSKVGSATVPYGPGRDVRQIGTPGLPMGRP